MKSVQSSVQIGRLLGSLTHETALGTGVYLRRSDERFVTRRNPACLSPTSSYGRKRDGWRGILCHKDDRGEH